MYNFIKHNGKIYENVDQYELDNNIKICQLNKNESKYYNLPISIFVKKKILVKDCQQINLMDFLRKKINLHYMSDLKGKKVKLNNLPTRYQQWFLFLQYSFNKFNNHNHIIMNKYNLKIDNSINPADFIIFKDSQGIIAPDNKKYLIKKHTLTSKYNPYDKDTFSIKQIKDIVENSTISINKIIYKIILL
tara:strand:+ start:1194 stop:1763 length:570 start_codon:yes stop_codon:yes gene_type:complete